jgi:pre-mRNA-processing factor 40
MLTLITRNAPPPPHAPQAPAGNRYNDDRNDFDRRYPEQTRRIEYPQGETLRTSFAPAASNNEPEYATYAEGEAAFFKMLKRCNAQPDWSWEETMRATIKDPQFRALKDPAERKAAFEKWIIELRAQDKEKEKERLAKLRQDFLNMLKSHPEIKHYTRWKTARPYIEGETIFRSASDDTERRQLFEDYIIELRKAHAQNETVQHKAAQEDLVNILHSLELAPYTRWTDARTAIEANEQFQQDDKFKTLTKIDVLTAFEEHVKVLEKTFYYDRNIKKAEKFRRDRKARDDFKALLKDIVSAGKFKAGSKWRDIYPLVEDDPRYKAAFCNDGSSPLDLFWDQLEELERDLRVKRNAVLDILDVSYMYTNRKRLTDSFTGEGIRDDYSDSTR